MGVYYRFVGKVVVIMGGVSGIGEVIVCLFVEYGVYVFIVDINKEIGS